MRSCASVSAAASGASSCSFFLTRWSAARRAERGPSPGRRASNWMRRSISALAATRAIAASEQLQPGRQRQAAGEALHLLLHEPLDLALASVVGGDDEVFEDLDLLGLRQATDRSSPRQVALAVERHDHETAAGLALDPGAAPSPPASRPCGPAAPGPASSCWQNSSWVGPVLLELSLAGLVGLGGRVLALQWSAPRRCARRGNAASTCLTSGCSRMRSISRASRSRR